MAGTRVTTNNSAAGTLWSSTASKIRQAVVAGGVGSEDARSVREEEHALAPAPVVDLYVGLGNCVYLWNACNSKVTKLCDLGAMDMVCSVGWAQRGTHLAVRTNQGKDQHWMGNNFTTWGPFENQNLMEEGDMLRVQRRRRSRAAASPEQRHRHEADAPSVVHNMWFHGPDRHARKIGCVHRSWLDHRSFYEIWCKGNGTQILLFAPRYGGTSN